MPPQHVKRTTRSPKRSAGKTLEDRSHAGSCNPEGSVDECCTDRGLRSDRESGAKTSVWQRGIVPLPDLATLTELHGGSPSGGPASLDGGEDEQGVGGRGREPARKPPFQCSVPH